MSTNLMKYSTLLLSAGLLAACDFEDKNINPNSNTSIEPGPLLTYTQLNTTSSGQTKNIQVGTCMMLVQQASSLNSNEAPGDKYYNMNSPSNSLFIDTYSTSLKNWREMMIRAEEDPKYENILAAGKIWGAYLFQRMTDIYGNVPYSQAGMGYYGQIFKPVYDNQEDIYNGMINEVISGISLLDKEKPAIEGDVFYNGDIAKWKKFGNSMLLRLAMRLVKVNPGRARELAAQAIAGGLMEQPADACIVKHMAGGRNDLKNPLSLRYEIDETIKNDVVKISSTFMNYLKQTADPRIRVYCSLKDGNTDPEKQFGLPNGYDNKTIESVGDAFVGLENSSNFNINTILKMDAPPIFLLPSESKLLHAEAVLRGWVSGDAASLFDEAVRLSMNEQNYLYGYEIAPQDVDSYIGQGLFTRANNTEDKLRVLGEQYWVATFMNGYESYANWRRTGYPVLTPTNYEGNQSNGEIPRRLPYATDEYTINKVNLDAAISQQGADNVNTRIWWDRK
ncbi:MAG: SusD/RagB family nutrient-binding outer membrane lipoprotein [Bacteroidales bacterium]